MLCSWYKGIYDSPLCETISESCVCVCVCMHACACMPVYRYLKNIKTFCWTQWGCMCVYVCVCARVRLRGVVGGGRNGVYVCVSVCVCLCVCVCVCVCVWLTEWTDILINWWTSEQNDWLKLTAWFPFHQCSIWQMTGVNPDRSAICSCHDYKHQPHIDLNLLLFRPLLLGIRTAADAWGVADKSGQ